MASGKWRVAGVQGLRAFISYCWLLAAFVLAACSQPLPTPVEQESLSIQIIVDDQTIDLTTGTATTVREALTEAGVTLNDADEITPPLFTPLTPDAEAPVITVVRITESLETILHSIPFERKLVRSEAMNADDPPRIIQAGQDGLEEETVRIVYRDGIEAERWTTQVTPIEPAQDEIVMVGVGTATSNVSFSGTLAYISGGNPVLLRGLSAFPESLPTGAGLDGRVFSLSPGGDYLLYSRIITETASFNNSLWIIGAESGAVPQPLGVENVLWADWDPSSAETLQIAYTTAESTNLPPGWEANNDLWLGEIDPDSETPFAPEQLIESYPATYGWWGGNYAWSPQGGLIAYSYANEVGVIDTETTDAEAQRRRLQRFTEYNTRSDWVWVPTLTWSPDGRFLAFTQHGGDDPEALTFDSWVVDAETGIGGRFAADAGMWAHLHWTPSDRDDDHQIAFLRAINPLDSQSGSYILWTMDGDGSNGRRLYPPEGETSRFPREQYFMAWGPDGRDIVFVFDGALTLLNLESGVARRLTQDDAAASHPTWSSGVTAVSPPADDNDSFDEFPLPRRDSGTIIPENQRLAALAEEP